MKYGKYIILALVLAGGLFSCQRDEDIAIAVLNINSEVIEPSYTSANVECYVECNTKLDNVSIEYTLTEDFADAQSVAMTEKEGKYRAKCENLLDDTTYYVRYIVSNRLSSMTYKEISSFRTLKPSIPIVHMDSISNIWDVKAEAFAHIEFDGGAPISDWGITIWADEKNDTLFIKSESQELCLIQIQCLQPNTIYHARAYAINKVGAAYSKQEITFTTFALPEVQTYEIADIQLTTAFLSGKLLFNGNDTATVKGFCWSENTEPTIEDALIQIDTITNEFSYHLSNLKDDTKYHVRAYAKNKIGVVYGDIVSFTTKAAILPTVVTTPVTKLNNHSATIGGNVTSDGGATVTERGVVYSTSQNPTTSNTKITSGTGTGLFTCDMTNLHEGTTYYVRAYAINKKGTSYGEQKSFTTTAYILPTVTTSSATNISYTSATVGGNVTNDGGATVTERGVVYSTSQNPTTSNTKIISGTGTGSFTCDITNLKEGTTYYVRAYAINKKGTSYGEQKLFTTKAYALPTITTSSATNVSYTCATVGGNVTSDGGTNVTERGVVYSTSQNPTTSNTKVTNGIGTGTFTCNIINLQDGITYYFRAYAINKNGTSYGEQKSFTTQHTTLPTVSISTIANITYISATAVGSISSNGGAAISESGFVYSISQKPTTSHSKVTSNTLTGSFSCLLSNLQEGTTYYVRAYAINKKGTAYSEQKSFITMSTPHNNNGFSISSSKQVVFSSGNLQYTKSTQTWSFAENQWDYIGTDNVTGGSVSSDPTYGDSKSGTALADKVDLFGWSTSATNFGVSTSKDNDDYSGSFVDWGTNKIGNDAPNTWRTLTYDEWRYLLRERSNYSELCGVAQVNGVNGLILLPDTWTCPSGVTFKFGFHSNRGVDYYEAYQTFTADQWSKLEAAGAVFLPATGHRYGSDVNGVRRGGNYWSATECYSDYASYLYFYSDAAYMSDGLRYYGRSVRLVKDL